MVSPYDLSVPGGVQSQVAALASALVRAGAAVDVLAPLARAGAPVSDIGAARLVPLGRSIAVSANGSQAPVAPFPATMARAVRRLRAGRYDIVHLHEPFVPGPTLAALIAGPAPIVGTFHRAGVDSAYRALGIAFGRLAGRMSVRAAVSEAACDTARQVLGRHAGEVLVLWNGVDVARIRAASPILADVPVVLFVGRHEERKGLGVLLSAITQVRVPVRVWVCGSGPETPSLRRRYGSDERVEWLGRVGDDDLARRLRGADIFCAPSLGGESFGLVVAEGLAGSCAVIASDLPGYRAAVGGAGVLVPPGDSASLATVLNELLTDPERLAELVERGDARADELSIDRLAARYLALYEGLVG
jgi:phosphatidyl-myo-inositol alpha-mannosyltransferase